MNMYVTRDRQAGLVPELLIITNSKEFGADAARLGNGALLVRHLARIEAICDQVLTPGSLALIDIDSFGGISRCFSVLRLVRRIMPDLPIVLTSAQFRYDDLTAERAVVADASIRWPTTATELFSAMAIAGLNNESWRQRSAQAAAELPVGVLSGFVPENPLPN